MELVSQPPASVPQPPWFLTGSALIFPHSWRSVRAFVNYETSPVGSYNELAIGALTRRGPSVTTMLVNSRASMIGGRYNWGFPKELAPLKWTRQGRHVAWEYSGRKGWARLWGLSLRLRMRGFTVQNWEGQSVRVSIEMSGRARLASRGRQIGLFIDELQLRVLPPVRLDKA